VTILGARFVTEFDMNREYRGMLRAEKITEGAPHVHQTSHEELSARDRC
jgi:hypothetical protein